MPNSPKKLPIGLQEFESIIGKGFLYADKTRYIYSMLDLGLKNYFLSRPRRFGKSLLLSTMESLFQGRRELFEGLYIGSCGYQFENHPVIRLNMNYDESDSPEILKNNIMDDLLRIAKTEGLPIKRTSCGRVMEDLAAALHQTHGTGAVLLIDEYDAPISRHVEALPLAEANAKVLHGFYSSLKNIEKHLHFAFVTGITRFALTAMDSGPNQFKDISLDRRFAGICGFTLDDFDDIFNDRLEYTLAAMIESDDMERGSSIADLREEIMTWYDGYNWEGQARVLNPFSLLNFFDKKSFERFWYSSGQPSHLLSLIRQKPLDFLQPKLDSYTDVEIRKVELERLEAVPVLFHSGYLTIDKVVKTRVARPSLELEGCVSNKKITVTSYAFRIPNAEVEGVFRQDCLKSVFGSPLPNFRALGEAFCRHVLERDAPSIAAMFNYLYSGIACRQAKPSEGFFHNMTQAAFSAMGFYARSESQSLRGLSDIEVSLPGEVMAVIELKFVEALEQTAPETRAQALAKAARAGQGQIEPKNYAGHCVNRPKRSSLLAFRSIPWAKPLPSLPIPNHRNLAK
jgi:hypothetical protein